MPKVNRDDLLDFEFFLPDGQTMLMFEHHAEQARLVEQQYEEAEAFLSNLIASLSAQAFSGELTATWRELHHPDLRAAAARRDELLRERGMQPVVPDAEERVRVDLRGKASKSVADLMQGLFDSIRLTWDAPSVALPQPLVETGRGMIGQIMAQAARRMVDTVTESPDVTRTAQVRMSQALSAPVSAFVEQARGDNLDSSFEREIAGHPREHLLRRLTVSHVLVWLTINTESGYVTLESLSEQTGLTYKALERILDVLEAGGLVTPVSVPVNPSGARVFVPAYRASMQRDEARADDLKLLDVS